MTIKIITKKIKTVLTFPINILIRAYKNCILKIYKIKRLFYNLLNVNYGLYYLHIGDMLTPVDGKLTAVQYITASRIIDICLN